MNKKDFYKLMKAVPKAEVHLHIEAVPTIRSIKALYKKSNGQEISDQEIKNLFTYEDLNGFIAAFVKIQGLYKSVEDFDYIFDKVFLLYKVLQKFCMITKDFMNGRLKRGN